MARPRRSPPDTVVERLFAEPGSFDFVQAMRIIDSWEAPNAPADTSAPLPKKSVRFVNDARLRFPSASIARAHWGKATTSPRLTISLLGLIGPLGTLPFSYTALAVQGLGRDNEALRAFLDMFQHRAVKLYYGAASKYRITIAQNYRRHGHDDAFTTVLRSLAGLGLPSLRDRQTVPDDFVVRNAGLFGGGTHSIAGLEALLSSKLGLDIAVQPFVGSWLHVPEVEQTRLPTSAADEGCHCALGVSAMVGERSWEVSGRFRIAIGPIGRNDIDDLLPDGDCTAIIVDIVRLYCGIEFDYDINLRIKAGDVPAARLAAGSGDSGAARLGLTSWILSSSSLEDRNDTAFEPDLFG